MKSRRKFIHQGGLTAVALFALKPIDGLSSSLSPSNSFFSKNKNLMLLHTSDVSSKNELQIVKAIKNVKNENDNSLYLHTCTKNENTLLQSSDVQLSQLENKEYKIIYRGNIKLGIINTAENTSEVFSKVNTISTYLKKERSCNLVICISSLGYKNIDGIDDINLAAQSLNLDVILSNHTTNYINKPFIAANSKKEEVIINHATVGKQIDLGKILFTFDDNGGKTNIQFVRK